MRAICALLLLLATAPRAEEPAPRFAWREAWPRFRPAEYVATGLGMAGAAANFYLVPPPKTAVWKGPILFDRPARRALLVGSERDRDSVKAAADFMVIPLMGYAMLDGPIAAGWAGGNRDTAIQLGLINAQTFAIVAALNLTISNTLPRSRPEGAVCDKGSKYDSACVKSFWSGHAANAFAAASLICVEHEALPLYGGGRADKAACGAALAVATAVGVSRITSNNHHASDIIVGAAVGGALGYWMPKLLHFRAKREPSQLGFLIPRAGPQGGGLTYVKTW